MALAVDISQLKVRVSSLSAGSRAGSLEWGRTDSLLNSKLHVGKNMICHTLILHVPIRETTVWLCRFLSTNGTR